MYCKNCGGDGHGAGECQVKVKRLGPGEYKAEGRQVGASLAMFSKPVTNDVTVTKTVTPGEPCPTCGHKAPLTPAQRQQASRARKGKV